MKNTTYHVQRGCEACLRDMEAQRGQKYPDLDGVNHMLLFLTAHGPRFDDKGWHMLVHWADEDASDAADSGRKGK